MNILLSTDNNYVMPTGVLMISIGQNCGSNINYYILTDELFSDNSKKSLIRIAEKYKSNISFYTITQEMTKDFPFGRDDQPKGVTIATYYRLFITEFLPKEVHKILYLDGDTIVRNNIRDLWDIDISNYAIGAVRDMCERYHCSSKRLPYDMECLGYFNAGVLLINVDYWRKNNCIQVFLNCIREHADVLKLHDQDVLNIVFNDKKIFLPITYNFQNCFLHKFNKPDRFWYIEDEIEKYKRDPAIVHFTAEDKPWKLNVFHTYTKDWRKYFFMSEWKNNPLEGEKVGNIKTRIRNFLIRHCWYTPATIYEMF